MSRQITVRATPLADRALSREVPRPENPFAPITEDAWTTVTWSPYYQGRLDAGELELQTEQLADAEEEQA